MRGWGFTFIGVVIASAFLPTPLDWYLLAIVAALFVISATTAYADARVRREVEAARETAEHREWTGEIKQMAIDDDEAWDRLAVAIDLHPAPLIFPGQLRAVRIPTQRTGDEI